MAEHSIRRIRTHRARFDGGNLSVLSSAELVRGPAKHQKCAPGDDVQQLEHPGLGVARLALEVWSDAANGSAGERPGFRNLQCRPDGFLDREQLLHIWPVDMVADLGGKRRAVAPMTVENEPPQAFPQALEVEKYQRLGGVDQHLATTKIDPVIADIPGRKVGADVADDLHPREKPRKTIEITLVGEAVSLDTIMAPLDAFLPPPPHHRDSVRIVAGSHPSDIVGSELAQPCELRGIAMGNNGGRAVPQFPVDGLR